MDSFRSAKSFKLVKLRVLTVTHNTYKYYVGSLLGCSRTVNIAVYMAVQQYEYV